MFQEWFLKVKKKVGGNKGGGCKLKETSEFENWYSGETFEDKYDLQQKLKNNVIVKLAISSHGTFNIN